MSHLRSGDHGDRNLRIYEGMLRSGRPFTPRDLYYYGNELHDHGRHAEAIAQHRRFLEGGAGWIEDVIDAHGKISDALFALGRTDEALEVALSSLRLAVPRANQCCRIGRLFLEMDRPKEAAHWYRAAAELGPPEGVMGFVSPAAWTWLPHLQLCVCYDRMGMYAEAYAHNELARALRPDDPSVLANKGYLEARLGRSCAG